MLSIKSFARAAPRAVSRLTASAIRRPTARPSTLLQSSWKPAQSQITAAFSTSTSRWQSSEDDAQLAKKLESEIEFENSMKEQDGTPASVKEYLDNSPFQLEDIPGQEEVVLTRQYNGESIRVTFSIADLNAMDPENDFEDPALGDEEDVSGSPKATEEGVEGEEGEELDQDQGFPARLNIVIEKAGKGALNIEAVAQNGMIGIHNLHHYPDVALAQAKTAEKAHEAQNLYVGPPFENLDEDLQVLLERYLDERGINTALAVFVPEYIEQKEQSEYLRWLSSVKYFVE